MYLVLYCCHYIFAQVDSPYISQTILLFIYDWTLLIYFFQIAIFTGSSTTKWTKLNYYCVFLMQVRFCLKVVLKSLDRIILGSAIWFCVFTSHMKIDLLS
jgi:hypothetical protein